MTKVTKEGSPDFVPVPERIATFDNDGTLWCEKPMYFQVMFAFDRIKATAAAASGMEGQAAVQVSLRRRHAATLGPGREGAA